MVAMVTKALDDHLGAAADNPADAGITQDVVVDIRQQLAALSERVDRLERTDRHRHPEVLEMADIIAAIRARRGSVAFRASEVLELFPASTPAHAAGLILAKVAGQPLGPDRLVVQRVTIEHGRRLWSITQAV